MITMIEAEQVAQTIADIAHCRACAENLVNAFSAIFKPIQFVITTDSDNDLGVAVAVDPDDAHLVPELAVLISTRGMTKN